MEEPAVLADWEQLYEIDVSRKLCSQLGKRKVEKYLSLADTIEMATDLELHANFLLDEALSRNSKAGNSSLENTDRVSRPPNRSLPDSQQKISDNADQYHQFNSINGNANAVDPKSDITRTYSDHNHNEKWGNSTRRKDLGHNSKDRKKEPFTFTSAKSVFVDEGGTFSHRKEDYKSIGNGSLSNKKSEESSLPQELAGLDKAIVEKIESEIIVHGQPVRFDDISGLEFAKQCVIESVCWYENFSVIIYFCNNFVF
jgi:SpoVK/Ycf46/Vps4 family AAA+-type ATPase